MFHRIFRVAACVAGLAVAQGGAAGAATLIETDSSNFSILDDVTRTTDGVSSGSFTETASVNRFDSSLGTLNSVTVAWALNGEVELGVFPNGPGFLGGSGTVSGGSTLSFSMDLATSTAVLGSDTVSGSHTGSIAGPPGAGSSDNIGLNFGQSGNTVFTAFADLALFTGLTAFDFDVLLTMDDITAAVADPGPDFGMQVGAPQAGLDVTVTYTYTEAVSSVAEPGPLAVLGLGLAGLGYMRRKRAA